ncbi:MAG: 4'-phosphopantetheinyl transferase superfamily protein [Gammaproteobacteria bacterium]|nr:4'-phosphopantetheinyl transferase superfamily protein [Gammaproteobacteria bacterium]
MFLTGNDSKHSNFRVTTPHIFANSAILITAPIADYQHALLQEEGLLIENAINKRINEFSTGRYCAHRALQHFGIENYPVLKGEQREPVWPEQIVGSITHCHDIAGAVVAEKANAKSIGLDIENIKSLNPNIIRHVCVEEEARWLTELDASQQNLALLVIFSLKEAVFKCIYQATQLQLRFKQCRILPDLASGSVDVQLISSDLCLQPGELQLRFAVDQTHVYSGALWRYLPAVG